VAPGEYTAVVISTTVAFNGTSDRIFIYPGQSGALKFDTINVVRVAVDVNPTDSVTVTATDGGKYSIDKKDSNVYYLERDKGFYFTATEATEGGVEKIAYASITKASSPTTLNLKDKATKVVITGYVGVVADGELTVTYGSTTIPFPISDGTFEITVPTGKDLSLTAKLSQAIAGIEYKYSGSTTMTSAQVTDKAKINFPATTTSSTQTLTELSGKNFNFDLNKGIGRFTLDVKNTGEFPVTYTITAGSAWTLDKGYTLTVGKGMTTSIDISGTYNPQLVGAGNPDLSVTVRSINGEVVGTYVLDGSAFKSSAPSTAVFVDRSGAQNASADAMNSHEYMFAVTITNNDSFMKYASITLNGTVGSNWTVVFSDKDGGKISPVTGTNSFAVNGFSSAVIYVKLMAKNGKDTNVPVIEVTVTVKDELSRVQTLDSNSKDVTHGNTFLTIRNMKAADSVEMQAEDMSASGNNIYNSSSSVPLTTLILMALLILFVIVMMWQGFKKGVFVRKR
jgi:hypothetical protein